MISLSDMNPRARNTINRGTGLRTLGMLTTILLLVNLPVGATIRTEKVRIGLDTFSLMDRISAEWVYTSSLISRM